MTTFAAPDTAVNYDRLSLVQAVLRQYPDVSRDEIHLLIAAYPRLSAVDLAHILSDLELAPKLEHFSRDHKSVTRTPLRDYVLFIVIAALSIAIIVWTLFMR